MGHSKLYASVRDGPEGSMLKFVNEGKGNVEGYCLCSSEKT